MNLISYGPFFQVPSAYSNLQFVGRLQNNETKPTLMFGNKKARDIAVKMQPQGANSNIPIRFGIRSVFLATTIVGILLHLGISVVTQSFAMLGVNLLLFYISAGIALSITSLAIMTLGSRASIVGALAGAAAWATLLWIVHNFEPSIQPYIPRHVVIFVFIAGWIVAVSAKTSSNGYD